MKAKILESLRDAKGSAAPSWEKMKESWAPEPEAETLVQSA